MGGVLVTLPSETLGSRWSAAYYGVIGVTDLVATSIEDYTRLAVRMGTDRNARKKMSKKILQNVYKLFHRQEGIQVAICFKYESSINRKMFFRSCSFVKPSSCYYIGRCEIYLNSYIFIYSSL
jgi:hypothetical protein